MHRFEEAFESHHQALAIIQETGDQLREARALANLGATYQGMGRSDDALAHYHRALAIFREVGDKYGEGTTLATLAGTYQDLHRTGDAVSCYQRALAVFEQANASDDANQIRTRLAELINTSPT